MTALSTHLYRTRGRRVYITNIVPCITILDSLHRLYHQCPIFACEISTTFVETNSRDAKELKYLRYKMCTQNALYKFISPFPFLFKFVLILILTNDINMIRCNLILPPS